MIGSFISNKEELWIFSYADGVKPAIDGFTECVAENDSLALYINREKATFALYNKADNQILLSNPVGVDQDSIAKGVNRVLLSSILSITYYDSVANQLNTTNNISSSLNEGGMKIRLMKNGAEFDFTFPSLKIMVPLQVQLLDDYFSIKVPVSKIEEKGTNTIYGVDVAPFFGAGGLNDRGFMLVPDGSGGLIHFNNGRTYANEYSEPVYGGDASVVPDVTGNSKETIRLPVFGIKNNKSAFLAVISEGDSQSVIHAATSQKKNSYNNIYSSFEIRKIGSYSLDQGYEGSKNFAVYQETKPSLPLIEIRYFPLSVVNGLKEMAATYKSYLIKHDGLKEKQNRIGPLISLIGAIKKKTSFLGIPFEITKPLTTFSDAKNIMQYFKEQGINDFDVRLTQWTSEQINGNIAKSLTPSVALGGRSSYKTLSEYAKDNGIGFYPQTDLITYTKERYPFQKYFEAAKNLNGSIVRQSFYKPSTFIKDLTKPTLFLVRPSLLEANTRKIIKSYLDFNATGLAINSLGSLNYSDFSSVISERNQTQTAFETSLEILKTGAGSLLLTNSNAYAFKYANILSNVPTSTDKLDIIDEAVPFYQLSISGLVDYTTTPLNLNHSPNEFFLNAIATGSRLQYTLAVRDTDTVLRNTVLDDNIGTNYAFWRESITQQYKQYSEIIKKTGSTIITDFENIQNGVSKTYYKSGKAILINYTDKDIIIDGNTIPAKGYFIEDGR